MQRAHDGVGSHAGRMEDWGRMTATEERHATERNGEGNMMHPKSWLWSGCFARAVGRRELAVVPDLAGRCHRPPIGHRQGGRPADSAKRRGRRSADPSQKGTTAYYAHDGTLIIPPRVT